MGKSWRREKTFGPVKNKNFKQNRKEVINTYEEEDNDDFDIREIRSKKAGNYRQPTSEDNQDDPRGV